MKKYIQRKRILTFSWLVLFFAFLLFAFSGGVKAQKAEDFKAEGKGLVSRVAPGEELPIEVKLMNFGEGEKVDVTISYKILNSLDQTVFKRSETVAVETTSHYVKRIKIPEHFSEGDYTVVTEIIYQNQKAPAVSEFQFTVEKKILGVFVSQFIIYSIVGVVLAVVLIYIGRFVRRKRASRFEAHDYSDVKKEERGFYEMIGDMIMQMRYQHGTRAIEVASKIDGLVIDENTGKVLDINKDPAEIVTLLMIYYKKEFGKKADFISKRIDKKGASKDPNVNKNVEMIQKYFSE